MDEHDGTAALELLAGLVPGIARALGPHCEVALHDRGRPARSIVALGNGHVTGRRVGDPTTVLSGTEALPDDTDLFNYRTAAPDGRALRSSTLIVRDGGRPVGYLCFNVDISELESAARLLGTLAQPEPAPAVRETFVRGPESEWPDELVAHLRRALALPEGPLDAPERRRLVAALQEQGVFRVRGAVPAICRLLGVARATLYADLRASNHPNR